MTRITRIYDENRQIIGFNNGVVFNNKDGIAEAWQNGKMLKIENNYLISTDDGLIKLSYN
jgi:hypothetical protein